MIAVYGAGGFALQILELLPKGDIIFVSDSSFSITGHKRAREVPPEADVVIAIADPIARREIAQRYTRFLSVFAATAVVSPTASIAEGAVVCDFVRIEPKATVGKHFHGNIYSYVAHECEIGDYVTFAPRVSCNGRVQIGNGAYIGAAAVIKQGVTIGENATIGMGAVVVGDVAAGATVVGNPARPLLQQGVRC